MLCHRSYSTLLRVKLCYAVPGHGHRGHVEFTCELSREMLNISITKMYLKMTRLRLLEAVSQIHKSKY